MAARAIWKGVIRLGDHELPVKLYSAVQEQGVSFRLLHGRKKQPVKQRMVNPETGKPVPNDEVHKGYEVEPGTFVMLDAEELAELEPEPSRDIEVTRCIPKDAIPNAWFDRAYYLGPDGDQGDYFALSAALRKEEQIGIARWVMRKKDYAGAVIPYGDHLMNALEGDFDITEYRDEYRERVLELIEAKASGRSVRLPKPKTRKASADSLGKLLEASLEKAKERKVA